MMEKWGAETSEENKEAMDLFITCLEETPEGEQNSDD
jgi:hypothetical protein